MCRKPHLERQVHGGLAGFCRQAFTTGRLRNSSRRQLISCMGWQACMPQWHECCSGHEGSYCLPVDEMGVS